MALYAASKAFVRNFSEALHDELVTRPYRSPVSALAALTPPSTVRPEAATTHGSPTLRLNGLSLSHSPLSKPY
ncbi:hypothetical protein [Pseudomonas aestiva]|uniref:hypothetical protein n=1 Tax=Pseudomonas aestiva TaxID=3136739 RepID=UPI0034610DD5